MIFKEYLDILETWMEQILHDAPNFNLIGHVVGEMLF